MVDYKIVHGQLVVRCRWPIEPPSSSTWNREEASIALAIELVFSVISNALSIATGSLSHRFAGDNVLCLIPNVTIHLVRMMVQEAVRMCPRVRR